MLTRRNLTGLLLAMPAIIRTPGLLMPISAPRHIVWIKGRPYIVTGPVERGGWRTVEPIRPISAGDFDFTADKAIIGGHDGHWGAAIGRPRDMVT